MRKYILLAFVCSFVTLGLTLVLVPQAAPQVALAGGAPSGNGDVNGDGRLDIADGIYIINYLLRNGPMPVAITCAPCDSCCPEPPPCDSCCPPPPACDSCCPEPPPCDSCCPPAPPGNFVCINTEITVALSWSVAVSFERIQLTRNGVLLAELTGSETAYTDDTVTPGATYSYALSGRFDGKTSASAVCTVTLCAVSTESPWLILPGNVPLEMVSCPSGAFMMGCYQGERYSTEEERYQHQVAVTRGFWLGKYEVTKRQWQAVMGTTPWEGQRSVLEDPNSPAVYVSWDDVQAFISAVNQLGQGTFHLPTEAQWEYACRAETTTRFYWGDDLDFAEIGGYAWQSGNAYQAGEQYAHVVGQKLPNAWGLYDMSGNVWEWCQDFWEDHYDLRPAIDPVGPAAGFTYVLRGGSWLFSAPDCRSAARSWNGPAYNTRDVGFRLARTNPQ